MRTVLRATLVSCLAAGCSSSTPPPDAFVPDVGIDAWVALRDAPDIAPDTNLPDTAIVVDVGADANTDATIGMDVGPACMPEGMYPLTWTGAATNAADCTSPAEGITVGPDGLDTGGTSPCAGMGCDVSNCQQHAAAAGSCTSSIHFDAPCHGLAVSQSYDGSFHFSAGGRVDATASTHRADGSSCVFTATGTHS